MRTPLNCHNFSKYREENGSYTIEAVFIVPLLLLICIFIILISVHNMQQGLVYLSSGQSADRVAQTWTNSNSHHTTGMFTPFKQDPLYWRWTEGRSVWGLITLRPSTKISVQLPDSLIPTDSLTHYKLSKAAWGWPRSYIGNSTYVSNGWSSSISVQINSPLTHRYINGKSTEIITEPAELIRNVSMLLHYTEDIRRLFSETEIAEMLKPWFEERGGFVAKPKSPVFRYHSEAVKYLRSIVKGSEKRFSTQWIGEWRLIDAMDYDGVAHQAYIGAKTYNSEMQQQLFKDIDLLRQGKVKGVVWHFFRRVGEPNGEPSSLLLQKLHQYGIVYIEHGHE